MGDRHWQEVGSVAQRMRTGLVAVLLIAGLSGVASAAERQRLCVIPPLALQPIFVVTPQAPAEAEDDDEDDEDEDEEEGAEEALGGFSGAQGTCIALGGGLNAAAQLSGWKMPLGQRASANDLTAMSVSANMQMVTLSRLDDGTDLRTTFGMLFDPQNEQSTNPVRLTDLWIGAGGWKFGFASSNFNFWTGDYFFFGTRIPARSAFMAARTMQVTEGWSAMLAAELPDPVEKLPFPELLKPIPGARWPDALAKLAYSGDNLEFQVAGVLSERRPPDGGNARIGKAAMVGAQVSTQLLGRPQVFTAQVSAAHDAPIYLGTQADLGIIRRLVDASDSTRGMSAQFVSTRQWTETISTSTYLSMLRLDFPRLTAAGSRARIWSGATSVIWSPAKGTRIAFETGISRSKMEIPGRIIPLDISARQITAIVWIDRRF